MSTLVGPPSAIDADPVSRALLDTAGVGLAVAEIATRQVCLTNSQLRQWLGLADAQSTSLDELFPDLDIEQLSVAVGEGRPFRFETEVQVKRRRLRLAVQIERAPVDTAVLFVECQNISKLRELEYMLQSYSAMVEKTNRELTAAKERVERLLLNIMPKTVYDEWKRFGVTTPKLYENATILMLDFVGFTKMAVTSDPPELIRELNDIFTGFDRIVEEFGCERLKTIGDAYLAVCGLPMETPDHANNIADVALRMRRFLEIRNSTHVHTWRSRIGIHSGPVVGSIVGVQKYVFDVFGPGVNTAARLEQMAEPMEILVSEATRSLLDSRFRLERVGTYDIRSAECVEIHRLCGNEDL